MNTFKTPSILTHKILDSRDVSAPLRFIGTVWEHWKNKKRYVITGVLWDGSRDEWAFEHMRGGCEVKFTRPVSDFFGFASGHQRFKQVDAL